MKLEIITPAKAEAYLNANKSNRTLRDGVVEKYANDMLKGRWTQCTAPIVFYEDGDIADGQHRLWAIIQANTPQSLYVLHNLPREAGLNIDTGAPRTLVDNARISGVDSTLSNTLVALVRAIETGERAKGAMSNSDQLALVERHREPAEWAIKHGPVGRGIRNAIVLAAIARAYMHEKDHDKLARYCTVLGNGFSDGAKETAAVAMRNYLLANSTQMANVTFWRDTFLKVQNSIAYFMKGRQLTVIKRVSEETYPLTGRKAKG